MSNTFTSPPFDFDVPEETFDTLFPWPQPADSNSPPRKILRTLAPNLTRRSHKKSRGGCFSCKTRKIKVGDHNDLVKPRRV
jgi:hypothetical protein